MPREIRIARETLIGMLTPGVPADDACREALISGVSYRIYAGTVALEETLRIYKQRAVRAHDERRPGVGATEGLDRLAASGLQHVLIGAVSADREYTLFLDPTADQVVACLAM